MLSTTQNITPERSLIRIATNSCYDLSYDSSRNRVYFTIQGYWKNADAVPNLLTDWDKALKHTLPGFTAIIDMQRMITHPQKLNKLHAEAQQKVVSSGVSKVANIMPADKIASLQAAEITTCTNLPGKNFATMAEAEEWLDQAIVS